MTTILSEPVAADRPGVTTGTKLIAAFACVCIGMRLDIAKGLTPGVVVMVVLAPVWWPQLRASRFARALVVGTVLSLAVGLALTWLVKDQRAVDWRIAQGFASITAIACAGFVVMLWARTQISVSAVVAWFVVGVLLYQFAVPGVWADDPWKFGFARPVTALVLLAVAWAAKRAGRPRPVLVVVVLVLLIGVSTAFNYRSEAGFLALTAVLVVWQAVAVGSRRRLRAASPALLMVTLAIAVYLVATQLFVSGALGADIQQRSTQQIEASGSLLLGGRPEWSATVELMGANPRGYGIGVLADSRDVQLAENGFSSINVDPATGYETYIQNYMMFGGFHLHSVAADLWAATGPVGILLSLLILVVIVWGMSAALALGRAEPLLIYSGVVVVWDIAFAPLNSSVTEMVLGLFLAVVSLERTRELRATPAAVPVAPAPASVLASDPNGGRRGPD